MKRRALRAAATALTIIVVAGRLEAAVIVSMTPTVGDLHQLSVGSPVSFLVELSGLPGGAGLDSLFATVEFDGSLLGTPSLTPGAVIPNPLHNPLDFRSQTDSGLADAAFLTLGTQAANHISSSGVFYSIQVTPLATGSGMIGLSFVDASQFNAANPNQPILIGATASAPLSFTVVPDSVPGDYNGNGTVDAADYVVWRNNRGVMGSPGIPGDGSGPTVGMPDGDVNELDYEFWQSRFGATSASGSGSQGAATVIPEPAAMTLLLLGAMWLFDRRR